MNGITIKEILETNTLNQDYSVSGWVRTKRGSKNVAFIMLNDGSCIHDLQIIIEIDDQLDDLLKEVNTGSSISVFGKLIKSEGKGQRVELVANKIELIGIADPDTYPIQPKKHTLEFLRKNAHLRFRTKTFSSTTKFNSANNQISIVDSDDSQDFRVQVNGGSFSVRDHTNSQTIFQIDNGAGGNALYIKSAAIEISKPIDISDTTQSTSKTTGALIVDGGAGIAKTLNLSLIHI